MVLTTQAAPEPRKVAEDPHHRTQAVTVSGAPAGLTHQASLEPRKAEEDPHPRIQAVMEPHTEAGDHHQKVVVVRADVGA